MRDERVGERGWRRGIREEREERRTGRMAPDVMEYEGMRGEICKLSHSNVKDAL